MTYSLILFFCSFNLTASIVQAQERSNFLLGEFATNYGEMSLSFTQNEDGDILGSHSFFVDGKKDSAYQSLTNHNWINDSTIVFDWQSGWTPSLKGRMRFILKEEETLMLYVEEVNDKIIFATTPMFILFKRTNAISYLQDSRANSGYYMYKVPRNTIPIEIDDVLINGVLPVYNLDHAKNSLESELGIADTVQRLKEPMTFYEWELIYGRSVFSLMDSLDGNEIDMISLSNGICSLMIAGDMYTVGTSFNQEIRQKYATQFEYSRKSWNSNDRYIEFTIKDSDLPEHAASVYFDKESFIITKIFYGWNPYW